MLQSPLATFLPNIIKIGLGINNLAQTRRGEIFWKTRNCEDDGDVRTNRWWRIRARYSCRCSRASRDHCTPVATRLSKTGRQQDRDTWQQRRYGPPSTGRQRRRSSEGLDSRPLTTHNTIIIIIIIISSSSSSSSVRYKANANDAAKSNKKKLPDIRVLLTTNTFNDRSKNGDTTVVQMLSGRPLLNTGKYVGLMRTYCTAVGWATDCIAQP